MHQDPGTPQRLRQNCERLLWWLDQQWSAAEAGALGEADLGMAALLEEVAINPTIELSELIQVGK